MSEHGTNSRYNAGCRCEACRAAHAKAYNIREMRKAAGKPYFVDAEPVRERVELLLQLGYTKRELARLGLSRSWLASLLIAHPRTGEPVRHVKREVAERVFAIHGRKLSRRTLVPSDAAHAMLAGWVASGLTVIAIARELGVDRHRLDQILHGRVDKVRAETLFLLLEHKDELDYMAGDERSRRDGETRSRGELSEWELREAWARHTQGAGIKRLSLNYGVDRKVLQRAFARYEAQGC